MHPPAVRSLCIRRTVVAGDEFRTSLNSCEAPHVQNFAPRFRGVQVVRRVRRPEAAKYASRVRRGFVLGLDAQRLLSRGERKGVAAMTPLGREACGKRGKAVMKWTFDGHSGQTDDEKKAATAARTAAGCACRYVRGLRVYFKDGCVMKFVDRDVCGSINIGIVWLGDRVADRTRPQPFVRPVKGAEGGAEQTTFNPSSKQGVMAEKDRTSESGASWSPVPVSRSN